MKIVGWDQEKLADMVELWNRELGEDFPMRRELFEQNSFDDINVCWQSSRIVLDEEGYVAGFVVAKRYQDRLEIDMPAKTGWIQSIVVDSRLQRKGIGTQLLNHAEETLKEKGMDTILLGRDPNHYFPGVPLSCKQAADWFASKGYKKEGTDYDLLCSYDKYENMPEPANDEVRFEVLDESDQGALMQFLHRCFPGRWEYEAAKYFQDGGTGREFVVLKKQGSIIGFCRINDSASPFIAQNVYWAPLFAKELGGIGPLGIDAAERGQGFGLAVVEAGIAGLRKRGVEHIVIDWTGLVEFYKKLGYDIWKRYDAYRKTLTE